MGSFYVLAILQNGVKFIQKLTPGFKNHMRSLDNFRQAVKVQKNEIRWATFVQKTHSFKHTLYTEDLSALLSATCSPNSLCQF